MLSAKFTFALRRCLHTWILEGRKEPGNTWGTGKNLIPLRIELRGCFVSDKGI